MYNLLREHELLRVGINQDSIINRKNIKKINLSVKSVLIGGNLFELEIIIKRYNNGFCKD